jgi:uncharacterized protein (DUF305 family)
MPPASHRVRAAALVAAGAVGACRTTAPVTTRAPSPAVAPAPQSAAAPGAAAAPAPLVLVGAEKARVDSARLPYTEADVRFMTHMIGHHAQAIEMSRLVPTRDASPAVRTLAERIVNAQQDEIGIMQQWLRDRGRPAPEPRAAAGAAGAAPAPGASSDHAGHAGHATPATTAGTGAAMPAMPAMAAMPGMLTAAQLAELGRARGRAFDRLFLQYMIQHHRGAVSMVRDLFATHGAGQDETVFKFATDVNVDQTTEIQRMQRMLVELLFQTPAAP